MSTSVHVRAYVERGGREFELVLQLHAHVGPQGSATGATTEVDAASTCACVASDAAAVQCAREPPSKLESTATTCAFEFVLLAAPPIIVHVRVRTRVVRTSSLLLLLSVLSLSDSLRLSQTLSLSLSLSLFVICSEGEARARGRHTTTSRGCV